MSLNDVITPEVVAHLGQRLRELYASLPDAEKVLFEGFCTAHERDDEVAGYMKGDVTSFDPGRHFARVLMQQGRVQLDADANEPVSILRRKAELALALLGTWPPR
jgi:hypothetical protein